MKKERNNAQGSGMLSCQKIRVCRRKHQGANSKWSDKRNSFRVLLHQMKEKLLKQIKD
jgi:hypothetical protein